MFFRRRPKYVTISAQVVDEWSFHIKADPDDAFVALSDWMGIMQRSQEGPAPDATPRVVGFGRTPSRDLGESEADTDIAQTAEPDEDDDCE